MVMLWNLEILCYILSYFSLLTVNNAKCLFWVFSIEHSNHFKKQPFRYTVDFFSRKPSSISNTNQVNNNNKNQIANTNTTSKPGGKPFFNMNPGRVNACMIKTFNRMKKRIGFLIYQFVLPAIQVGFCNRYSS